MTSRILLLRRRTAAATTMMPTAATAKPTRCFCSYRRRCCHQGKREEKSALWPIIPVGLRQLPLHHHPSTNRYHQRNSRTLFTEAYADRILVSQRAKELIRSQHKWQPQDWLDAEQIMHALVMFNASTGNGNTVESATTSFDNIGLMMMVGSDNSDGDDDNDSAKEFKFRSLVEPVHYSLDLLERCRIEYEKNARSTNNNNTNSDCNDDVDNDDDGASVSSSSSSVTDFVDSSLVHAAVLQWHRATRLYTELNGSHKKHYKGRTGGHNNVIVPPGDMVARLDRWNTSMKDSNNAASRGGGGNGGGAIIPRRRVMGKTWTCVIDASARCGETELAALLINHVLLQNGYCPSPGTVRVVLQAHAARGQIKQCRDLINSVLTETLPQYQQRAAVLYDDDYDCDDYDGDTTSYNAAGGGVHHQHQQLPPFPLDIGCYNALLHAYAYHGQAEQAETLLEEICQGLHPTTLPSSGNLGAFLDRQQLQRQQNPTQQPAVTIRPNISTFNVVLNAWSRSTADDAPERAQGLLMRLYDPFDYGALSDTVQPDAVTFNTVLNCWTSSRRPDAAAQAHALLRERQEWRSRCDGSGNSNDDDAAPTVEAFGCVLDAYAKSGNPNAAEALFDELLQTYLNTGNERLRPNLQTMTPLIEAWLNNSRLRPRTNSTTTNNNVDGGDSRIEKAENVLRRMHQLHNDGILEQGPDRTAYHALLNGYANYCGRDIHAELHADAILQEMIDLSRSNPNIRPSFTTYSIVIQTWAKRPGGLERAKELLEEVLDMYDETKGDELYKPDSRSMDSIIQKLAKSGHTSYPTQLLRRIVEEEWTANNKMKGTLHSAAFGSVIIAYKNKSNSDPEAPYKAQALVDNMIQWHEQGLLKKGPDYLMYRALLGCWTKSASIKTGRNNQKAKLHDRKDGALAKALSTLNQMRRKAYQGVWPHLDIDDYNILLKVLSRSYHPHEADRLLQEMIRDFTGSKQNGNNSTPACPNLNSFHHVLWGFAHCIGNDEALLRIEAILDQMEQLNRQYHHLELSPDTVTYNNLLHCLSNIATIGAAQRSETILQQMRGGGRRESTKNNNNEDRNGNIINRIQPSPVSYQCVIDTWVRCSALSQAERVLELFYVDCLRGTYTPYEKAFVTVARAWMKESKSLLSLNKNDEARTARQRAEKVRQWWEQLQIRQNLKRYHREQNTAVAVD